jgi:hypothetical protein
MKKISILLLSVLLLLSFAGCNNADSDKPSDSSSQASAAETGFVFKYNGIDIALNGSAEPIIAQLGEPRSYTEEPSCAFEGLDKTYYYGSFYVSTYPLKDKDYIQSVWFADDSVATEEGIRIGSAKADVETAYGADAFNGNNAFMITKADTKLTVILKDGFVSSIQYEIVIS